jgi:hypothetical protein
MKRIMLVPDHSAVLNYRKPRRQRLSTQRCFACFNLRRCHGLISIAPPAHPMVLRSFFDAFGSSKISFFYSERRRIASKEPTIVIFGVNDEEL